MLRVYALTSVALLAVLCGCSYDYDQVLEKYGQTDETKFARTCLENVRIGHLNAVIPHVARESVQPGVDIRENLAEAGGYFPGGEPTEIKLVGYDWVKYGPENVRETNLVFQYSSEDGWAVAYVALVEDSRGMMVKGLWVNRIPESLDAMNTFTLRGRSFTHYAFLFLAVAIPVLIVWSLIRCIRTPMRSFKWLWIIFILVGFCALSLNWSTGEVAVQIITLRVPAVIPGRAGPYAPWTLTVSIPLGAIVFLLRKGALVRKASEQAEDRHSQS